MYDHDRLSASSNSCFSCFSLFSLEICSGVFFESAVFVAAGLAFEGVFEAAAFADKAGDLVVVAFEAAFVLDLAVALFETAFAVEVGDFAVEVGDFAVEVGGFAVEVGDFAGDFEAAAFAPEVANLAVVAVFETVAFVGDFAVACITSFTGSQSSRINTFGSLSTSPRHGSESCD
jgi:hypothetical protein